MRGVVLAVVVAWSAPAGAQDDRPTAEALFREGRQLLEKGEVTAACDRFEASRRLEPAPGTLLNLGDCLERLGRVAGAWVAFSEAATFAARVGDGEREGVARRRARALEPRLARIVVRVPAPVAGLVVLRDGLAVNEASYGRALVVDPGGHTLTARAPGHRPYRRVVELAEGTSLTVDIPALEALPGAAVPPPPVDEPAPAPRAHRWLAMGTLALSLASAGVGTYYGLRARSSFRDAERTCDEAGCDPRGVALAEDAVRYGDISTGAFVVAGVTLAGGVVLWFTF
jgi:serine/threonine-protein kinase